MAASFLAALLAAFAQGEIVSVFLKGSSRKPWNSPIDYVPEFSDVDIHVRFRDEPPPDQQYVSLEAGLRIQEATEREYHRCIPRPVHVPRLQFIPVNILERQAFYTPSPASTIETLYGRRYESAEVDEGASRESSRQLLLEQRDFLRELGEHVADKQGRHLWDLLRLLPWRVAPAGPRVLELLGTPYVEAWSGNRSTVVRRLEEWGQAELAAHYTAFYLRAWDYVRSRRVDSAAGRDVIRAGAGVLAEGVRIAESA